MRYDLKCALDTKEEEEDAHNVCIWKKKIVAIIVFVCVCGGDGIAELCNMKI
jgi:hypothetical protein